MDDVVITTDLQGDQNTVTMHVKQGQGEVVVSILRDMQAESGTGRMSLPPSGRASAGRASAGGQV